MTRTAWFHCFAGTAGDMTLGALVHAGADPLVVAELVGRLAIDDYALSFEPAMRCGIAATRAVVVVHGAHEGPASEHEHHDHHHDHPAHRPYREIRELLDGADLPTRVRARAQATFRALAEVEAQMHRMDAGDVELHEVGSLDAIVDVVGACAALESLGIDRIVCSPITVGQGTVRAAHGVLPNPAPATMELLARRGAPSRGVDDRLELATPTGVALMTALADEFGPLPAMAVEAIGYGAGTADVSGRPNVVQVVVGTAAQAPAAVPAGGQPVQLLETNVDDATGEVLAHTISAALAAGAHDAWATPIVMKKGRPAHTVHALCDPALASAVGGVLVRETGTLGLRGTVLTRWPQGREETTVTLDGQVIRVKLGAGRAKVEHDDAVAAAAALGRPLRDVLQAAESAATGGRMQG
jgi:pyridinium-3,5-bisthiocarboxylic acid mononucleotide nickel chelatase